jgi:hypothetical protein
LGTFYSPSPKNLIMQQGILPSDGTSGKFNLIPTWQRKMRMAGFQGIDHALANASGVGHCTATCTACSPEDSAPKVSCNACKFPAWLCSWIAKLVEEAKTPDEENFML